TILVIPASQVKAGTKVNSNGQGDTGPTNETETQEEPISFITHKVKKKETLYGIAKKYKVSEDQIKKYNRVLYSAQLKKRMELRITKYRKVDPNENTINEEDFEIYTVATKETRWSIAHKYGITIDSMVALNPPLAKNSDYLAEGQELLMPKKPGSTIKNQVTELFISYTVPAKMNFYQLEKKFNVKSDEIVRLNPEIMERGGLKEGMVIRIPERKVETGDVNTDNYIFYEVKPKQTEFSLTRKLGIAYKDLLALNPDLKNGLKAGMVLKLPKEQTGSFEVRNALVLDAIDLLDSINTANRPKIMFFLPFRLNRLNFNDKGSVEEMIAKRKEIKLSLGIYSGALVALDSIADLGISVDVKTFDNELDQVKTKALLSTQNLTDISAIIGPLDVPSLKEVAQKAAENQVPVIAPRPPVFEADFKNVFFSYPSDELLRKKIIDYTKSKMVDQNIVIIADSSNAKVRDLLLKNFPDAKVAEVKEEKKNIGVSRDKLATLFSEEHENWVFVESDNYKLISSVSSILNSFNNALLDPEKGTNKVQVRMFTTYKNEAFENEVISSSHLSKLNFTYPSISRESANDGFVRRYRERFGDRPDTYA
ncbi:MAG: LysM peptidoglycan-binding domain-containing protein, partial [Flavobacteriaceae bacterium]